MDWETHFSQAINKIEKDDYSGAINDFNIVIELKPGDANSFSNRGFAKGMIGDFNGAITDYNKAIELNIEDSSIVYFERGFIKSKIGDNNGALIDYTQAIKLDPRFVKAYCYRGTINYNLGNYLEAIEDYDKTIELDPKTAEVYKYRGNAKYNLKDFLEANQDYNKAKEVEVDYKFIQQKNQINQKQISRQKKFDVGIKNSNFINVLNELRKVPDSFWSKMVEDKDLFFAIRHEAINVYYKGNSIIKLTYNNGEVVGSTYYKFLLNPELHKYIKMVGEKYSYGPTENMFIPSINDFELIKKASFAYSRKEKTGIHSYASRPLYAIDIEITFSSSGSGKNVNRIDMASFHGSRHSATGIKLVFYEVKHIHNEMFKTKSIPEFEEQIVRYEATLKYHEHEIIESYQLVSKNLVDLNINKRKIVEDVAAGEPFSIDCYPRFMIFGFDKDSQTSSMWVRHRNSLEQILGDRLICLYGSISLDSTI